MNYKIGPLEISVIPLYINPGPLKDGKGVRLCQRFLHHHHQRGHEEATEQ
jgi:hypothetical protein